MYSEDRDAQWIAAIATLPPMSHDMLHWDGINTASRGVGLTRASGPATRAAVPSQEHRATEHRATPPIQPCPRLRIPLPQAPISSWETETGRLTFCLEAGILEAIGHKAIPRATGTLLWLQEDVQVEGLTPAVHPALLVQTASVWLDEKCVELVPHLPADDPLFAHMELALQAARAAAGITERLYAEALADALAVHFLRRYAACGPLTGAGLSGLSKPKLQRTIAYIEAHLAQELSVTELAAVAQTSPAYFARLFRQATGQTPHQYVIRCRIEHAKRLLRETEWSITEIGHHLGFTDQSYFTAVFRKHVATTPKAYRGNTQR